MKMAGYLDPMSEKNDMAMEMFGKQLKDLTESELELLDEEIDRLRSKFMADGGRVSKQTGGITEQRVLPPEFIEAAQRTFLTDLATQSGLPSVTTATTQQPGETAAQFAQRQAQAQQFGITRAGMAELAPQVAAQDPLQAAAYTQATDPTTGLGSFQPFLTKAGTAADAATGLTGTGAGTGAGSISSYMSPYQQQVIDTTLQDFDQQAQIRQNQLAAAQAGTDIQRQQAQAGMSLQELEAAGASEKQAQEFARQSTLLGMSQQELAGAQQARAQARADLGAGLGAIGGLAAGGAFKGLFGGGGGAGLSGGGIMKDYSNFGQNIVSQAQVPNLTGNPFQKFLNN